MSSNLQVRGLGEGTSRYTPSQRAAIDVSMVADESTRDALGRVLVSSHQNIFDADFEYGRQPLRWEELTAGAATIAHLPGEGGVRLRLTSAAGDVAIRQSRPYHRYQPGKTLMMASAVNFGVASANQVHRVGFFDDGNGVFFLQSTPSTDNPFGIFAGVRSDSGGLPVDTLFGLDTWVGSRGAIESLDWTRIQMVWIEYAWYGAGAVRWGVFLNGERVVLHQVAFGNRPGQVRAWSRTGNLPVRYEQRNTGASTANDMVHYGVSVLVEGQVDDQRGFTYAYGLPVAAPRRTVAISTTRFPVLSYRGRPMGVVEFTEAAGAIQAGATTTAMTVAGTPFVASALVGRAIHWPTLNQTARITANTTNTVTYADPVTGLAVASAPGTGIAYLIGLVNRGQMLPRRLQLTSDQPVLVEIFMSRPGSPVNLTGASFLANAAAPNSFAQIDSSATALTLSGEMVYSLFVPANTPVDQSIDNLFPLLNTIRGNLTDILTVAVTNPSGTNQALVSCQIIGQEAMS